MAISDIFLQRVLFRVFLCFTFLLVYSSFEKVGTVTNGAKIILPLIHRDSSFSPFHKSKQLLFPSDDIRGRLMPDDHKYVFLVNVSIGEPPVPQMLVVDSGSKLIWVCTKCSPGLRPAFDPMKSLTYSNISCSSMYECVDYYYRSNCEFTESSQCSYTISYIDETYSTGILATEKFTFQSSSEGIFEVPNVAFGFGVENNWKIGGASGVFGLEPIGPHSLTSILGNKFSYCLGNISDPFYMYNHLILGDGAILDGPSTPMERQENHFVVNFDGISVGEKKLRIDRREFGYNTLIDSGTTFTKLSQGLYGPLRSEIMDLMDGLIQPVEIASEGKHLCYLGNLVRDLRGFPVVTLHFAQGADLNLNAEGLFYQQSERIFCLAVNVNEGYDEVNIVGVYAQQYHNIGFDMNAMNVSFQDIDCSLLED